MGKLVHSEQFKTFIFQCAFTERNIPKSCGFQWNDTYRFWHQPNPFRAMKLERFADDNCSKKFDDIRGYNLLQDVKYKYPKGFKLHQNQREALQWLVSRSCAYLAADPGLGKTIISIVLANSLVTSGHLKVIAPPFLIRNWRDEIEKWDTSKHEFPLLCEMAEGRDYKFNFNARWVLVPDSIINEPAIHKQLIEREFAQTFIDEAHRYKSEKAQRTVAITGGNIKRKREILSFGPLFKKSGRITFLSGTPIPNRPIELFPLISKVAPWAIHGRSFIEYAERYCGGYQDQFGYKYDGATNLEELREMLIPKFMLYQNSDNYDDIPEAIIRFQHLEPDEDAREILKSYQEIKDELLDEIINQKASVKMLGAVAKLRRALGLIKVKPCIEHLKECLENDEKLVVFAWHQDVIHEMEKALKKYNPLAITGSVAQSKRHEMVKSFQSNDDNRIFIGNIQAAGIGITLTASHRVKFVESSWVPGENEQAIRRVRRYTQKKNVLVDFLTYPHDLDERIIRTSNAKQKTINKLIKGV